MIAIKNILVATDFGGASDAALEYGREFARHFGATLHVLHVARNVMAEAIGVEGYTTDFMALQHEVEEAARRQLEGLVSDDDRRMFAIQTMIVTSNSPALSIVSFAKDAHIDLIVVGTHGRGGMAHLFMGSVAERVVRTAPCPVVAVKQVERVSVPEAVQAAHVWRTPFLTARFVAADSVTPAAGPSVAERDRMWTAS